jgi:hypothetical protein
MELQIDELTKLANLYASDKGTVAPSTGHHGPRLHFTPVYSKYFEHLRYEKITILEIGVGSGPSLKMWYDYFPNSSIHAIDVVPQKQHENERVKTHICDQSDRFSLMKVMENIEPPDIIIDDGSHVVAHQQISLGFLFQCLKEGGQYWIEDLHTSDRTVWNGKTLYGYDMTVKENHSTVEVIEKYIDSKTFDSPYMLKKENAYITDNCVECKLFDLPPTSWGFNKLAYFKKGKK